MMHLISITAITTLLVLTSTMSYSAQYSIQLLPRFVCSDINNQGQIAGYTYDNEAAIWSAQGITILGSGSDKEDSQDFVHINNNGQIIRSLDGSISFWENSSASPVAIPNDPRVWGYHYIYGMNDHGDFVGHRPAFVWRHHDSTVTMLEGPTGGSAIGRDINNEGVICGTTKSATVLSVPFIWRDNQITELQFLPGYNKGDAFSINDSGNTVGRCAGSEMNLRACLWIDADSAPINLGVPDGYIGSQAYGINNRGEIIGRLQSEVQSYNAFIWKDGVISDLNSLISPDSGWDIEDAVDISDSGQIIGYGYYNGDRSYYLLIPVPEPSSILVLLCGLGTLSRLAKFKKR